MNRPPNPFDQHPAKVTEAEKLVDNSATSTDSLLFPQTVIIGSIGELAHELANGTEVPEEFYFAVGVTLVGAIAANRIRLAVNIESETRLYTVLLGGSGDVKKSTALRRTIKALLPLLLGRVEILPGVGSAEGLARVLADKSNVLLCYDELKSLFDKCRIEGSGLLAMIASFFEGNRWSNPTKDPKQSVTVTDGHLSMIAAATLDTYASMWTPEAISIGLPNRLFVVSAYRKRKEAWPKETDHDRVERIVKAIARQLDALPKTLGITPEAKARWTDWYLNLSGGVHAKRLDALGFRLMQILALVTDRQIVDLQTVDNTLCILDYELRIRRLTDPIDADNMIARLEEKIRRTLAGRGPLTHRNLLRFVNANRTGLWAFESAISNLKHHGQIRFENSLGIYTLCHEEPDDDA